MAAALHGPAGRGTQGEHGLDHHVDAVVVRCGVLRDDRGRQAVPALFTSRSIGRSAPPRRAATCRT